MIKACVVGFVCLLCSICCSAINGWVSGKVVDEQSGEPISGVEVLLLGDQNYSTVSNKLGEFHFDDVVPGTYSLSTMKEGFGSTTISTQVEAGLQLSLRVQIREIHLLLSEVEVSESNAKTTYLQPVQDAVVYSGMKSEVITPSTSGANTSAQSSRQTYAQVAGLNVWESDGAGIQLGIGTRGLSPNRTSHFNVRQNGYDISADALGYPESYYTPPLEAVDRIELVRGAASLQYGTQFGGLLNFRLKQGGEKKLEVVLKQTVGSYGLDDSIAPPLASSNTFISAGGSTGKLDYYGFCSMKSGSGWRPNSGYRALTGHVNLGVQLSDRLEIRGEVTLMNYLAQQPGGLIDSHFNQNPRQSNRSRNWFAVDWKLGALKVNYQLGSLTELKTVFFGLDASRKSLGVLGSAGRVDPLDYRNLIVGRFSNWGNETRLVHRADFRERIAVFTAGIRVYSGLSHAQQGLGSDGSAADFAFFTEEIPLDSEFEFPNLNLALFTQEIIPLNNRLSLVPGLRLEYIRTRSEGYLWDYVTNGAGEIIEDSLIIDEQSKQRSFVLAGCGFSWKAKPTWELYGNVSQNYRAINFSDIQLRNVGLIIDPEIHDERGLNADIGFRGNLSEKLRLDVSVFMLYYRDRIGEYYTSVPDPILIQKPVRFRTNVSDARNAGVECFVESNVLAWLPKKRSAKLTVFANVSLTNATYIGGEESVFTGNRVELVPRYTVRTGLSWQVKRFKTGAMYSLSGEQYSDATNATFTPSGVDGEIPAYAIFDAFASYEWKSWSFSLSANNLMNSSYFTRRATGYPGPGIIPSDGRTLFFGVQKNF